ncbi:MAG: hypothetical protein EOP48_17875, partial [Sphingobacteriales bacterium]
MNDKEIIVKIDKGKVYLTPDLSLPFTQTNILYDYLKFNDERYWLVSIESYNSNSSTINLKVVDFNGGEIDKFQRQCTDKIIEQVVFAPMKWAQLLTQVWYYQLNKIGPMLEDEQSANIGTAPINPFGNFESRKVHLNREVAPPGIHSCELKVPFSALTFKDGYVSFDHKIKDLGIKKELSFVIPNPNIISAFEEVKSYFSKKLSKKRITVRVQLLFKVDGIEQTATSDDID